MKPKFRRAAIALTIAAGAAVLAQEISLAWSPKQGDALTYALKMEFSLFGDIAIYTSKVTEKVVEAAPDKFVIETTQTDYKVTVFGEEGTVNDKDMPKAQTVFSLSGDVLELRGDLVNDAAYRMANLTAIRRPEKAVKVGDTWVREIKGDLKTGVLGAKANYKVEAEEKVKEVDALVTSFEYLEVEGADPARSNGKVWFAKQGGRVLKVEATWTSAPIPGAPAPVNGSYLLELQ